MSTWLPALAPAAVALVALLLPGLVVGRVAGLRGLLLLGAAPALSVGALALTALAAPAVGLLWGPGAAALGTALATLLAVPVGLLGRRPRRRPHGWSRRRGVVALAAAGGLALGGLVALRRLLRALGSPTAVSQSYDAVFHLNAVRWALDHADASSLHIGAVGSPERAAAFYPAGWHAVVVLAAQVTGAGPDVATNATAVVVAVVVWPLSAVALVRALLGPRPVALAAAGALPVAFLSQPVVPLEWGVLYPTLLAHALLPATLGLLVLAAHRHRAPRQRGTAALVAVATLPGIALAQPSGLFALAALALPLAVVVVAGWAVRRWRAPRGRVVAPLGAAAAVVAAAAAWWVVDGSGAVASLRSTDWAAEATVPEAIRQAVLMGHLNRTTAPALAVLVLLGAVAALRRRRLRWLVAAHVVVSALFVLAWGSDSALSLRLTGFWYNDAFRLAGLAAVTGLPLAALALSEVADALRRLVTAAARRRTTGRRSGRRSAGRSLAGRSLAGGWPVWQLGAAAAAVLAVMAVGRGPATVMTYDLLAGNYASTPDRQLSDLLDSDERALLDRVDEHVPPGVAVAGNPWTGAALVYALADRPTPFAHMTNTFDPPRQVVAERLRDATTDPAVCPAVESLDLGYVLDFDGWSLWGGDPSGRDLRYPGLSGLREAPGFEVVDAQGPAALLRITACDA